MPNFRIIFNKEEKRFIIITTEIEKSLFNCNFGDIIFNKHNLLPNSKRMPNNSIQVVSKSYNKVVEIHGTNIELFENELSEQVNFNKGEHERDQIIINDPEQYVESKNIELKNPEKSNEKNKGTITIGINRTAFSHARCFICQKSSKLHVISNDAIRDTYIKTNIIITPASRCCTIHFDEHMRFLTRDSISKIQSFDNSLKLSADEIVNFLRILEKRIWLKSLIPALVSCQVLTRMNAKH